jgi:hypothetical protein
MRFFGGTKMKARMFIAVLLALLSLGLAGIVQGGDNEQLMVVFTTDTGAELNPCG